MIKHVIDELLSCIQEPGMAPELRQYSLSLLQNDKHPNHVKCNSSLQVLVSVKADYTLEIMLHAYQNPLHLALDQAFFRHGCCEGDRTLPCLPCDNSFQFCLQREPLDEGCDLGFYESDLVAQNNDDLMFSPGDDIGGLTNPLLFSGTTWPVSITRSP